MHDVSDVRVADMLQKDFKKWTVVEIENLRLLAIVSGYYNTEKNFKRELLVSVESTEFLMNVLRFFDVNASQLPLSILPQPGLKEEMKAFEIDKFTSRKNVERLLEEFCSRTKSTLDMSS
ncbi:hypothetical protein MLD38_019218 [Melastoma candidum]|uniref:Uncharacterized protein n=1 Tax=Melastoma candidum TaxID=119954 RepID=A0ACB9QZD4_9MYRT|nr:hypothetical protein MLD38_019218 [Melastoma candidum]